MTFAGPADSQTRAATWGPTSPRRAHQAHPSNPWWPADQMVPHPQRGVSATIGRPHPRGRRAGVATRRRLITFLALAAFVSLLAR